MREQEKLTTPDELERLIGRCERLMVDVTMWKASALDLLRLRDQIEDLAASLESRDIDIRPLRNRMTALDAILRERARQVVAKMKDEGGLAQVRQELKPDRSRWWWYPDEALKRERAQAIRGTLKRAAILVIVVAIILIIITQVGREQAAMYRHLRLAKESYMEGRYEQALEETERAIAFVPNEPLSYIWRGIIYGRMGGQEERAVEAFQKARSLFVNEIGFHIQKGSLHFEIGELEEAYFEASEARKMDPDYPEAMFLLARLYLVEEREVDDSSLIQRDTAGAIRLLKALIPLAEGKPQLQATAKLTLAQLGDIYTVER